jgi:sortase B
MLVGASDDYIFEPDSTRYNIKSLLQYAQTKSLHVNEDVLNRAIETEGLQILALSTCSSEFTDARTIVLTVMKPYTASGTGGE